MPLTADELKDALRELTMTADELKDALRQLSGLMELPRGEVKKSVLMHHTARLAAAVEDDDFEVPADVFEGMNPLGRKLALAGFMLAVNQALRS